VGAQQKIKLHITNPMTQLLNLPKLSRELLLITPIFTLAVVAGATIEVIAPTINLQSLLTFNPYLTITLAAILGLIFPIPRYATYPLALALWHQGAGLGTVYALICGEVVFESLARDAMEIKYFGIKFFTTRALVSLILIITTAIIIEMIL